MGVALGRRVPAAGAAYRALVSLIKEPVLLAFSTASSEAAYPKTLEQLERFGASKKIRSFVLPLGYSFNLDGSMMYCKWEGELRPEREAQAEIDRDTGLEPAA